LEMSDPPVEARQRAQRDISQAIELEPGDAGHWIVLGRLRELGREERLASQCFERAIGLDPVAPEPRLRLALVSKRQWLRTLEPERLARAIAELDTVTMLRPYGADAWLGLVPLRYERGDLAGAPEAAERGLEGRPRRIEAPP